MLLKHIVVALSLSPRPGSPSPLAWGVILLTLLWAPPLCGQPNQDSICAIAKAAIGDAVAIRGLPLKKPVPCEAHTKEQVKEYLLHTIDTKIPPGKLESEEKVFKLIGLIPESFAYKDGLIQLYVGQIGGYYDPEKDYFVMASWMPAMLQTTIAVHELTHALQDQHFNLETFLDHNLGNTDLLLARSALIEGDASLVMTDYTRKLFNQLPLQEEKGVENLMLQNVIGASMMTAFGEVPEGLQLMLIFPYTSGLRFAHQLLRQGGYSAIDKAFANPPRTTEEILHPHKYPSKPGEEYEVFNTSSLPERKILTEPVYTDTFGEFGISLLLSSLGIEKKLAAEVAAGWGGDFLALFETQTESCSQGELFWITRWDTEQDAREFYNAVLTGFSNRFTLREWNGSTTTVPLMGAHWDIEVRKDSPQKVLLAFTSSPGCR